MRDEDNGLVFCRLKHRVVELILRDRIERRRRLVEDHERRVLVEHTRDRELLLLTA